MKTKRMSSALLIILLLVLLFNGCAGKTNEAAQPTPTGADSTGGDYAIGSLSYILNGVNIPADYTDKLNNLVAVNERLYFANDNKIYTMDKAVESVQEVISYTPLEGYSLVLIGRNFNGSLMAIEQSADSCLISWVEEDGTVSDVTDITDAIAQSEIFIPISCFSDISGSIYILLSNSDKPDSVMIIGADGTFLYSGYPDVEGSINSFVLSGSGKAYIAPKKVRASPMLAQAKVNLLSTPILEQQKIIRYMS